MNIEKLRRRAEERVRLEYDAWAEYNGAERTALVYQTMLKILDEEDKSNFETMLMVARAMWENKIWSVTNESFPAYLCDIGGRYEQADGKPSGVAYDLANYVSIVWDVLEEIGENPVELASRAWSKTRLTVSTVKQNVKMFDDSGAETHSTERAVSTTILDPEKIRDVVRLAKDSEVTYREMASQTYVPRIPRFTGSMSLKKNGTWDVVIKDMTEQQLGYLQRLLKDKAELRLE